MQPYRETAPTFEPCSPTEIQAGCFFCRLRRAARSARGRRALFIAVLSVLLVGNVASALLARAALRDAKRALAVARSFERTAPQSPARSEPRRTPPPPAPPAPPSPAHRASSMQDERDGVFRLGATEFFVERPALERALEQSASGLGPVRILPDRRKGVVSGVRVFGVDQNSILGMLGLQDGDSVQAVNGFDIATPDRALEAYARLRTADEITVRILRRGSELNLRYHLS